MVSVTGHKTSLNGIDYENFIQQAKDFDFEAQPEVVIDENQLLTV